MTAVGRLMVSGMLTLVLAACGDAADTNDTTPAATSTTSAAQTNSTETTAATTDGGKSCVEIASKGLKLATDYANESRGIAGADEEKYKAKARALRDEAESAGCEVPAAVNEFIDG